MPCQYQSHGPVSRLNRHPPGHGRLVGVGGTDDGEPGDFSQTRQLLHGLMCWAILTHADAVVREHVNDWNFHQCREPNRRTEVIGEGQKGRAERPDTAMDRQAIQDRPHAVLAHSKLHIAARINPATTSRTLQIADRHFRAFEIALILQLGLSGRVQIRRTTDQTGQFRFEGIQHFSRGDTRSPCPWHHWGIAERSHPSLAAVPR